MGESREIGRLGVWEIAERACHTAARMVAEKARTMETQIVRDDGGLVAKRAPAFVAPQAGRVIGAPASHAEHPLAVGKQRLLAPSTLLQHPTLAMYVHVYTFYVCMCVCTVYPT